VRGYIILLLAPPPPLWYNQYGRGRAKEENKIIARINKKRLGILLHPLRDFPYGYHPQVGGRCEVNTIPQEFARLPIHYSLHILESAHA
jgi:hypothetical protein